MAYQEQSATFGKYITVFQSEDNFAMLLAVIDGESQLVESYATFEEACKFAKLNAKKVPKLHGGYVNNFKTN